MSSVAVKNFATCEVKNVFNVKVLSVEDRALVCNNPKVKDFGERAMRSYDDVLEKLGFTPDGFRVFRLKDGWEIDNAKAPRAPRKPKSPKAPKAEPQSAQSQQQETEPKQPILKQYNDFKAKHPDAVLLFRCGDFYETYGDDAKTCADVLGITLTKRSSDGVQMAGFPYHALDTYLPKLIRAGHRVAICDQLGKPIEQVEPKKEEPKPKPTTTTSASVSNVDATAQAIANALKGLQVQQQSTGVDEQTVRSIVKQILAEELPKQEPKEVRHTIKVAELPAYEVPEGTNAQLFKTLMTMVVNDRVIGRFPWLYGPAGSGKSTMAKMVADALGIPFYSVSSLQQKYELEGYADAVGEFVQTSFYKAMAEGGVFCFDEISTTSGEVQVAFNTAAAQLVYNFPKVGMVQAHPDFHIIACDNSTGRGGDKRYNSRFQLDASTLDRYNFVEVGYSEEHDLRMAAGDKELVEFMHAIRKVLDEANTTDLATPRASKAIKALEATGMTTKDALWYGLCSGWKKQDIRTYNNRISGRNKWFATFDEIANNL